MQALCCIMCIITYLASSHIVSGFLCSSKPLEMGLPLCTILSTPVCQAPTKTAFQPLPMASNGFSNQSPKAFHILQNPIWSSSSQQLHFPGTNLFISYFYITVLSNVTIWDSWLSLFSLLVKKFKGRKKWLSTTGMSITKTTDPTLKGVKR